TTWADVGGPIYHPAYWSDYSGTIIRITSTVSEIFVCTQGGTVFHSTTDGESWQRLPEALTIGRVNSLAAAGNYIFASSRGIWRCLWK
ncbi:MAG TPA: hypothetical protein VI758_01475, partial [Bacteroidota bacterium]